MTMSLTALWFSLAWPSAVNLALAKVEAQLRHYKEKIQDRRRTPSAGEAGGPPLEEPSEE